MTSWRAHVNSTGDWFVAQFTSCVLPSSIGNIAKPLWNINGREIVLCWHFPALEIHLRATARREWVHAISPTLEIKDYINHLYRIAAIRVFREPSGENELKCNHTEVILMKNVFLTLRVIDSDSINCDQASKVIKLFFFVWLFVIFVLFSCGSLTQRFAHWMYRKLDGVTHWFANTRTLASRSAPPWVYLVTKLWPRYSLMAIFTQN